MKARASSGSLVLWVSIAYELDAVADGTSGGMNAEPQAMIEAFRRREAARLLPQP